MSEHIERTDSLQPMQELATSLAEEMGERPEERLDWLMQQTGESFGDMLVRVNATARGLDSEIHGFDGEHVKAGTVGASVPPDQEDKIMLLDELVTTAKRRIVEKTENGEDAQAIISELAVAIPTVVNKLHLFADANGRASRLLRMAMRDGDQITPEKVETLVNKSGSEKYDASPVVPIDLSVRSYMRRINETSNIVISDDLAEDDGPIEMVTEEVLRKYPTIDPRVIRAYSDGLNFYETVLLVAKEEGKDRVSLTELFAQLAESPEELAKFTDTYRRVRKQRVEVLIAGLTGEQQVPLAFGDKESDVRNYINRMRKIMGRDELNPDLISTIQDFQIAYCETYAPLRTET